MRLEVRNGSFSYPKGPDIFRNLDFVLNELKAKGLCRDFLAQQKDRGDRTHV